MGRRWQSSTKASPLSAFPPGFNPGRKQIRLWWICQQRHFWDSGCFFFFLNSLFTYFFQTYLYICLLWVEVKISWFYADIWNLWFGCLSNCMIFTYFYKMLWLMSWGEPILGPLPRTISLVSNGSNLSLQRSASINATGRPYPPGLGWTPQVTPHDPEGLGATIQEFINPTKVKSCSTSARSAAQVVLWLLFGGYQVEACITFWVLIPRPRPV